MANGIRTGDPRGFNKGRTSKYLKVPEFDKHLKKAVVETTIEKKTLNDKNQQASSKKFRQLIIKLSRQILKGKVHIQIHTLSYGHFSLLLPQGRIIWHTCRVNYIWVFL